ncbi:MAG: hypothetical protein R2770_09200 [Acidimicrobiales bacterium]
MRDEVWLDYLDQLPSGQPPDLEVVASLARGIVDRYPDMAAAPPRNPQHTRTRPAA